MKISRCLATGSYRAGYVPTKEDLSVKEYIRMRDDHKLELKRNKQQILGFCLRNGFIFTEGQSNWTQKHMAWPEKLKMDAMLREVLDEYLLTYRKLLERIEEISKNEHYAAFLRLVPSEHSSGEKERRGWITKAGNCHLRRLLVESAQCYGRGKVGYKSKALKSRQKGNSSETIHCADRANERLLRKFYKMIFEGKAHNVAKTAVASELAYFVWRMMTEHVK